MRVRRTVKEKDVIKILVFGCDRRLIKSAMDSGFRSMSAVLSYANCMAGDKPVNHIRISNESRGWCGSYTLYGKEMNNIITNANGVKVKVRVYDFGDEVADRYTIVYVNKNIKDGYGVVYYPVFSCSEDPFHPLGVGMYAGDYYPHRSHMYNFGKRVKDIDSLPKKVIEFIKYITR